MRLRVASILQARVQQQCDLCVYAVGLVPKRLCFCTGVHICLESALHLVWTHLWMCKCLFSHTNVFIMCSNKGEIDLFNLYLIRMNFWIKKSLCFNERRFIILKAIKQIIVEDYLSHWTTNVKKKNIPWLSLLILLFRVGLGVTLCSLLSPWLGLIASPTYGWHRHTIRGN